MSEVVQIGSYLRDAGPVAHNSNLYDPHSPQVFHSSVAEHSNRFVIQDFFVFQLNIGHFSWLACYPARKVTTRSDPMTRVQLNSWPAVSVLLSFNRKNLYQFCVGDKKIA